MVNCNLYVLPLQQVASDICLVMLIEKVIIFIFYKQTRKKEEGKFFVNLKEHKLTRIIYSEECNLQVT